MAEEGAVTSPYPKSVFSIYRKPSRLQFPNFPSWWSTSENVRLGANTKRNDKMHYLSVVSGTGLCVKMKTGSTVSTEQMFTRGSKKREVPLHTLLAASAEVLPLELPVLVVMVPMTMMMMVVRMKVGIVHAGGTASRSASGPSVDHVLGRALVDHMWVVTFGGAVVVLLSEMSGHRSDQVFLLRHPDET